ncbi:MAG: glycosyltransferase family 4 protein [Alphaproteobacteria bacterium]
MITLPPVVGGVVTMALAAKRALASDGFAVTAAHRVAFSERPDLSVPLWRLPFGRPRLEPWPDPRLAVERLGVGTYLPEFEWAHYQAWQPWRALIERFPKHIVVTGNALTALSLVQMGLPTLNWVATDYLGDRVDRFRQKKLPRRIFDQVLNRPVCAAVERFVLERADVLALSEYTAGALKAVTPKANLTGILRAPVERTAEASRSGFRSEHPVIGFAGRLSDPRKNVPLLFAAFRHALADLPRLRLRVVGDLTAELAVDMGARDLIDRVEFVPPLQPDQMDGFYAGIDGFVISSHQEGLAIVGLEAMAQGVPVASTRCGGPQEYVIDDETGYLADFDAAELGARIVQMLQPGNYARLSANALALVRERYGWENFRQDLLNRFHALYTRV